MASATLTDPWGTSIELTEGLRGVQEHQRACVARLLQYDGSDFGWSCVAELAGASARAGAVTARRGGCAAVIGSGYSPRARRGAIRICRATTPTPTRTGRRSSVRTNSPAASSRTSPARSWPKLRRGIQQRTIANFEGPIHAPDHWWQDNLDLHRGSQAWLVIDPPDGKIPPHDPGGPAADCGARRGAKEERPWTGRFVRGSQPVRPLHHARPARLDDAGHLRQPVSDRPVARICRDPATR